MSDFLVALSPNARIFYKLVSISVNFCFNAQSGNQNGFNEQFYSCLLLSKKGISCPSLIAITIWNVVFLFCMSNCTNLVVVVLHYSVFTAEEKGGRVVYSRVNYSIVV